MTTRKTILAIAKPDPDLVARLNAASEGPKTLDEILSDVLRDPKASDEDKQRARDALARAKARNTTVDKMVKKSKTAA